MTSGGRNGGLGSFRLRSGASSVATAGEALLLLSGDCAEEEGMLFCAQKEGMLFPENQEKKLQQQHLLAIVAQDGYAAISL